MMLIVIALSFVALMLLLREQMFLNIAVSVVYVFGVFLLIFRHAKKCGEE